MQFAGAVPLSRQEKFSRQMMQLQQDKQKLEIELKQVNRGRQSRGDDQRKIIRGDNQGQAFKGRYTGLLN